MTKFYTLLRGSSRAMLVMREGNELYIQKEEMGDVRCHFRSAIEETLRKRRSAISSFTRGDIPAAMLIYSPPLRQRAIADCRPMIYERRTPKSRDSI